MSPKVTKHTKDMKGESSRKKKQNNKKAGSISKGIRSSNKKNTEIMKTLIKEGKENRTLEMITIMTKKIQEQTSSKHLEIITEIAENNKMYKKGLNLATEIKHLENLPKMIFKKFVTLNKSKYLISNRLEVNMDNTSVKEMEKELALMIGEHDKIETEERNTNVSYSRIKRNEIKEFLDTVSTDT